MHSLSNLRATDLTLYFPAAGFPFRGDGTGSQSDTMPLSAEQQRERRAAKRAAEEAAGVFRRRRGRLEAGHVWDGTTHRALRRGIMSAKAGSGISVMRSDLDASTSTEVDAHEAPCDPPILFR